METKKIGLLAAAVIYLPATSFAQGQLLRGDTYFSNALFNTLLIIILLLLIVNVGLGQALKSIAQSDYLIQKPEPEKKTNEDGNPASTITGLILLFSLFSFSAGAGNNAVADSWLIGGLDMFTFYFMVTIIVIELIVMVSLLRTIRYLLGSGSAEKPKTAARQSVILKKLTAAIAIEEEEEIMLSHNYDGIRELDNDLPPWWKYGFYLTIVVAVVYLIHYHVIHTGDLQVTEYNKEVEKGKQEVAEYMKNASNNVDETTVKMLEGADLESGKGIFISTCAACHGKLGEGGVGPNLTDEYWLHGGSLQDIFKTIKYGWPDKGMKSWKEDLSPVQMAQVASYIRTLKGTLPLNGKPAQGDLYKEEISPADSLRTLTDTTRVAGL
ncbi:MAG: cbb3-type cytochrome c oxidase N-terminal domain-containing protein [Bacteroidia bacterium]